MCTGNLDLPGAVLVKASMKRRVTALWGLKAEIGTVGASTIVYCAAQLVQKDRERPLGTEMPEINIVGRVYPPVRSALVSRLVIISEGSTPESIYPIVYMCTGGWLCLAGTRPNRTITRAEPSREKCSGR